MKTFKQLLWFVIPLALLLGNLIYKALSYSGSDMDSIGLRIYLITLSAELSLTKLFAGMITFTVFISLLFGVIVLIIRFCVRKKDGRVTMYLFYPWCIVVYATLMYVLYAFPTVALFFVTGDGKSETLVQSLMECVLYPTVLYSFVLLITWLIDKFIFRRLAKTKQLEN